MAKHDRVIVKVKDLLSVLQRCCGFASTKDLIPVLQHMCFRDGRVLATDGVIGIVGLLSGVVMPDMTLPSDGFVKLLGTFPEEEKLQLSVQSGGGVEVQAARYTAIFQSYPVSDFPIMDVPKDILKLRKEEFEGILWLRFAVSQDRQRTALQGVFFDGEGWGLATDHIRIAWRGSVKGGLRNKFIPDYLLKQIVGWEIAPTGYAIDAGGRLWLVYPDFAVCSVLPAEAFPDMRGIIASAVQACTKATGFRLDREQVVGVLRRLLLTAEDINATLELSVGKSELTLRVPATASHRDTAVEVVSVKRLAVGKENMMRLNGRLLLEAVERFEEFFLIEQGMVAFTDRRTYGHVLARLVG